MLSTPPAFVLSQDQTLQDILELFASSFIRCCRHITDGIFGWFHIRNPHSGYVHFLRNDHLYIVQFSKIRCRFSVVTVLRRLVYLNTFNRECQELFFESFSKFLYISFKRKYKEFSSHLVFQSLSGVLFLRFQKPSVVSDLYIIHAFQIFVNYFFKILYCIVHTQYIN